MLKAKVLATKSLTILNPLGQAINYLIHKYNYNVDVSWKGYLVV